MERRITPLPGHRVRATAPEAIACGRVRFLSGRLPKKRQNYTEARFPTRSWTPATVRCLVCLKRQFVCRFLRLDPAAGHVVPPGCSRDFSHVPVPAHQCLCGVGPSHLISQHGNGIGECGLGSGLHKVGERGLGIGVVRIEYIAYLSRGLVAGREELACVIRSEGGAGRPMRQSWKV